MQKLGYNPGPKETSGLDAFTTRGVASESEGQRVLPVMRREHSSGLTLRNDV